MFQHVPVILLPAPPYGATRTNSALQLHTSEPEDPKKQRVLNPFSTQHNAKSTFSHVEAVFKYSHQILFQGP